MNKQVIHLFGASGSGVTTLGRFISEQLGCFFMDTDDYFWQPTNPPFTTKRERAERIALMRDDIARHDGVVISGSLADWGDELIPLFTLAIRVETETSVRIDRLHKRERARFGSRLDPGGDMYENHRKFLDWAAGYDTGGLEMRSRAAHDEWQKLLKCPLILVDGTRPVEENFERCREAVVLTSGLEK